MTYVTIFWHGKQIRSYSGPLHPRLVRYMLPNRKNVDILRQLRNIDVLSCIGYQLRNIGTWKRTYNSDTLLPQTYNLLHGHVPEEVNTNIDNRRRYTLARVEREIVCQCSKKSLLDIRSIPKIGLAQHNKKTTSIMSVLGNINWHFGTKWKTFSISSKSFIALPWDKGI